jgi:cytochrome b561
VQHPTIETGRYTLTAQALHWLTVLLILTTLPVAWVMMSLPTGPQQTRMLVLHRSLGVTIFAVVVARLAWRLTHPAPPVSYLGLFNLPQLPKDKALGDVANVFHHLGQWGLYTLVGLHVGATIWHVAIRRDGLLSRMIPPQDRSGSFSDAN